MMRCRFLTNEFHLFLDTEWSYHDGTVWLWTPGKNETYKFQEPDWRCPLPWHSAYMCLVHLSFLLSIVFKHLDQDSHINPDSTPHFPWLLKWQVGTSSWWMLLRRIVSQGIPQMIVKALHWFIIFFQSESSMWSSNNSVQNSKRCSLCTWRNLI